MPSTSLQRRSFLADALAARADVKRTGTGYDAAEVHAYLKARAAGTRTTRPKATITTERRGRP